MYFGWQDEGFGWSGQGGPKNTVLPVLSVQGGNDPLVGEVLETTNGTWTGVGTITYTYKWFKDGVEIPAETAQTYTIQEGDQFSDITCQVTATDLGGHRSRLGNAITIYGAPVNLTVPVVTSDTPGNPVGCALTTTDGTWNALPAPTFSYQWQRNGVDIVGETNVDYVTVNADLNAGITCVVTATNSVGSDSASGNAIEPVSAPINTVAPALSPSGTQVTGTVITCSQGTWIGTNTITYTYQWKRNGSNIGGETASTYTLVAGDDGTVITCEVTATNTQGATTEPSSNQVDATNFTPASISGLQIWLKADAGITLVGGEVDVWADQSGNGRDAIAPSSTQRPDYNASYMGGLPFVVGRNTTPFSKLTPSAAQTGQQKHTLFGRIAFTAKPGGGYENIFNGSPASPYNQFVLKPSIIEAYFEPAGSINTFDPSINTVYGFVIVVTDTTTTVYINGASYSAANAVGTYDEYDSLFSYQTTNGYLGGINQYGRYNVDLSGTDLDNLKTYIGA